MTIIVAFAIGCGTPAGGETTTTPAGGETATTPASTLAEPPATQEPAPMSIEPPWSIRYHDGSGNGYRFWQDDDVAYFEYTPVTPEMSSSGTYSGGEPANGELTAEQALDLWNRVETLREQDALRAPTRAMGTGSFQIASSGESGDFLIRRSTELSDFEAAIALFR